MLKEILFTSYLYLTSSIASAQNFDNKELFLRHDQEMEFLKNELAPTHYSSDDDTTDTINVKMAAPKKPSDIQETSDDFVLPLEREMFGTKNIQNRAMRLKNSADLSVGMDKNNKAKNYKRRLR